MPANGLTSWRRFRQGLAEVGYVEGQNVTIDFRWSKGQPFSRFPEMAADMVRRQVSVIIASGPAAAVSAKAATTTIPFVFTSGGDVIRSGLVASLNRPGGNGTGVSLFSQAVDGKKLELLGKLVPTVPTVAFLLNPNNPAAEGKAIEMQGSARALGRQLHILNAGSKDDIEAAFATLVERRIGALVVMTDPFFDDAPRRQIIALAAQHAMPAIYGQREYVVDGGLISYGTSLTDAYRQKGVYTGRILKGEKPSDLPVVQPIKFELVINSRTAKALGIEILPTLLATADEVIE